MKNITIIKRRFLKNILLALGVCGAGLVTACCKYGVLIADYAVWIKGTVRSKDLSQPIPGITVKAITDALEEREFSDINGVYTVMPGLNKGDSTVILQFSDTDGSLNGSFQPKDTVLKLTQTEIKNFLKEGVDIKLSRNE